MGMPMSWTALSIIHYCIARLVDPLCNFRIKGDDLIAYWSLSQISAYRTKSETVGLVVNEKTWVHKTLGTFCEGDYELTSGLRGMRHTLKRLATFSLKSFVKDEPFPYEVGERFVSRGVERQLLIDMQSYFHREWKMIARRNGVNEYAPARFGGLGFVPKQDHPLDDLTCRMVNASHNGTLVYDERNVIDTVLARRVLNAYQAYPWSVNGTLDARRVDNAWSIALSEASFMDYHIQRARKTTVSRNKRVRSLAAHRRKFAAAGCKTVLVPTSVQTAYRVISRLKPVDTRGAQVTSPIGTLEQQ
jgi:hypothetical protein